MQNRSARRTKAQSLTNIKTDRRIIMTNNELKNLACEISSVSVFRGILKKKEISALLSFLKSDGDICEKMERYGEFVYSLADYGYSFSSFLERSIYEDENAYVCSMAQKKKIPDVMLKNAEVELSLFSRLTGISADDLCSSLSYSGYIPKFENKRIDFEKTYHERLQNIEKYGYGIFSTAGMFKVSDDNEILPVEAADDTSLEKFIGYSDERMKILENTKALIEGRPALNALLCGDAGTGKSSTVKACANHFRDMGVRLIEIRKDQLFSLPKVMGEISGNPLKFIIFVDDLSFNKNDDCFSMLKAALEGSASAKSSNAVIYATSNRRHIVKENFSDRAVSDDVHHSDTVQELMSLSDRFGLVVYFSKPPKALYLDIVQEFAKRCSIEVTDELLKKAEEFALRRGSRSPRAAEQFIKSLL